MLLEFVSIFFVHCFLGWVNSVTMDLDLRLDLNFLHLVQCGHLSQKICCTPFLV